MYNFRIPRRFLFFRIAIVKGFLAIPLLISIKISVFQWSLFQCICLLLRFLFNFAYFSIPRRLLFSRCDRLGISGDSSFELYRKLSSNVLYFFLDVCYSESSSTFYFPGDSSFRIAILYGILEIPLLISIIFQNVLKV